MPLQIGVLRLTLQPQGRWGSPESACSHREQWAQQLKSPLVLCSPYMGLWMKNLTSLCLSFPHVASNRMPTPQGVLSKRLGLALANAQQKVAAATIVMGPDISPPPHPWLLSRVGVPGVRPTWGLPRTPGCVGSPPSLGGRLESEHSCQPLPPGLAA